MVEKIKKQIGGYVFSPDESMGKGSFGTVYKGQVTDNPGQYVAIKQISINVSKSELVELRGLLANEIGTMQSLSHRHIIKLVDVIMTQNNLYIITEFCNGGDPEKEALTSVKHIAKAMDYANSQNVIHRDLKPANILINDGVIKIADFGLARFVEDPKIQDKLTCRRGSPLYMAPEVFKGKKYCQKCDVWSVGIIFYELLFKTTPWTGTKANDLFYNIMNQALKFPKNNDVDPLILDLIENMLQVNQNDRYDFKDVLKHEAFNSKTSEKIINKKKKKKSDR